MSYSSQYSRFNRKPPRQARWRRLLLIFAVLVVAAVVFLVVREFQRNPSWIQGIADNSERVKAWVIERKQNLNQTVAKVKKQVGETDPSERTVNFEFYNTLQDMKSMQVDVAAKVTKSLEETTIIKPADKPVIASATKVKKPVKITRAADLEKDLLSAMKQPRGGK